MLRSKLVICVLIMVLVFTFLPAMSMAKIYTIATDPLGSNTYSGTASEARILNKYTDNNFKVKSTAGATEIAPLLAFGEVEIGTLNNYEAQMSYLTKENYKEPLGSLIVSPFRTLTGGTPVVICPLTAASSGILTGTDLKGKRFAADYTSSVGCTKQGLAFLANWGLTADDVIMLKTPGLTEAVQAVIDGRADVSGTAGPGMPIVSELDATRGARFLSINPEPEALKAYLDIYSAKLIKVEPAPDKPGVREPIYMMVMEDFLISNKNLISDEMAYEIVKTLWENAVELSQSHASLTELTPEMLLSSGAPIPYHPGAIKFYKEKGIWSEAIEARNQDLLEAENSLLKK
ncbi:hypothetical protein ES705_03944 [subsurface metagenome]